MRGEDEKDVIGLGEGGGDFVVFEFPDSGVYDLIGGGRFFEVVEEDAVDGFSGLDEVGDEGATL